jgi:uncharacterized protein (TIGR02266 family)
MPSFDVLLTHPVIGQTVVQVGEKALILGRSGGEVDVALDWDKWASRRHARLWAEGGALWLEDAGSKNGCWLGTTRLTAPHRLAPGEPVYVGSTVVSIKAAETLPPPAPVVQVSPIVATPAPGQETDDLPPARQRCHPRFTSATLVVLRGGSRDELRTLWMEDISNGGLFVRTDTPPRAGTKVAVEIETPGGHMWLRAEVVHVLDRAAAEQIGHTPGVGLQFIDLSPDKRRAIERYVDGVSATLGSAKDAQHPEPRTSSLVSAGEAAQRAGKLLVEAESRDHYTLLGIAPETATKFVRYEIDRLREMFEVSREGITPPQAARVQSVLRLLDRMRAVFGDEDRRLEYDFGNGYVRAEARIAEAAGGGRAIADLRRMWDRVFPGRRDTADRLITKAYQAKKRLDMRAAIEAGTQALDLDPFHVELRKTVDAWKTTPKSRAG